ncbi:hypothetical protein BC628DRAFT_1382639 [Trametes gibbosa]|nr:hypothetical protein BC628DRAFT_1382639 [Trametes gibbosa]
MSSYSSTSLSGSSHYARTDTSSPYPSSPSTSPGSTPPSPFSLKPSSSPISPSFPRPHTHRSKASHEEPPQPERRGEAGVGIDPASLVGKTLTCVRRSRAHPSITLHFTDGASFQVRVVGYDPQFRGVPKKLESDSAVLNPLSGTADVRLTVKHAAMITLADKAFQVQPGQGRGAGNGKDARETRWTQKHVAFAIKFDEEPGWHCMWATLAEYDAEAKEVCVFRNFADVYVDSLHPPSTPGPATASAKPRFRADPPRARDASPAPKVPAPRDQKGDKPARKARRNKKTDVPKSRW